MKPVSCDIVAFAAHPDDIELTCGGTLALAGRQGWKAAAVDFTRGELSTRGTVEERSREAQAAAQVLGLTCRLNLELPDGHVRDTDENRKAVVRVLRTLRPTVVIAPPLLDHHPDHMGAAEILHRCFYLCGVEKYAPGEPPWRPHVLLHYLGSGAVKPDIVVDISSVHETRMEAIRCYGSQFYREGASERETRISQPEFLPTVEAVSRHMGHLIGVAFGEGFTVNSPVPAADIVSLYSRAPWARAESSP
jgi:bacillithiol biosynthesis deacetylase BshB1